MLPHMIFHYYIIYKDLKYIEKENIKQKKCKKQYNEYQKTLLKYNIILPKFNN